MATKKCVLLTTLKVKLCQYAMRNSIKSVNVNVHTYICNDTEIFLTVKYEILILISYIGVRVFGSSVCFFLQVFVWFVCGLYCFYYIFIFVQTVDISNFVSNIIYVLGVNEKCVRFRRECESPNTG